MPEPVSVPPPDLDTLIADAAAHIANCAGLIADGAAASASNFNDSVKSVAAAEVRRIAGAAYQHGAEGTYPPPSAAPEPKTLDKWRGWQAGYKAGVAAGVKHSTPPPALPPAAPDSLDNIIDAAAVIIADSVHGVALTELRRITDTAYLRGVNDHADANRQ